MHAPSALSRRLADLEAAMGVPLLIRSPSGVEFTDAAERDREAADRPR
nr:LysR family transcriptional regulator [Burkholderia sp. Nafp2/4-1b]